MPAPLRTAPAKTFGRENIIFIPAIAASVTLAPTVAEATAASALDLTRTAFQGGEPTLNGQTERVKPDKRFGDVNQYEMIGETTYEGGDAIMAWKPQDAPANPGKTAWSGLAAGTTGFLAKREDIARDTDIVAGQRLSWVVPVEFGPPIPTKQGEGSAAQAAFKSAFAITGEPKFDVVVLA